MARALLRSNERATPHLTRVATQAAMAGAAAGDRDGGDPKHGELARDEKEAKTGGALLLRRLLEATNVLVSSTDRDEPYRDGYELDSGARARQWRRVAHSLLRRVNGARTGRGRGGAHCAGARRPRE